MSQRSGFFWLPQVICGCGRFPQTSFIEKGVITVVCRNVACSNAGVVWRVELEQAYGIRAPIIPS